MLLTPASARAQTLAAALTVTYPGVEVQLAGATNWLPLRAGAIAPLAAGDTVRTDDTGRALITFGEAARWLVLPRTTVQIREYESAPEGAAIGGSVDGRVLHATDGAIASFALATPRLTLTAPADLMAIEASAAGAPSSFDPMPTNEADAARLPAQTRVIVADGSASLTIDDATIDLTAGDALRVRATADDVLSLPLPASFAAIDSALDGCPGVVDTNNGENLRLREGPGTPFPFVDTVADGSTVGLMGINAGDGWYRVQLGSGFVWALALAIDTSCAALPVFPDAQLDRVYGVIDGTADEIALLEAFYGAPEDDTRFYRGG